MNLTLLENRQTVSILRQLLSRSIYFLQSSEDAFLFVFAPLVGLCTGLGAVGFTRLIEGFHALFFEGGARALSLLGPYYVILLPAIGGLIVGPLVIYLALEAKGHGVTEVIMAVHAREGHIRARVALVMALASSIGIGSGGSVGREGPFVQIGSALGSSLGQVFKMTADRVRILVACGAAGGLAATFNIPLGGIFFSLEVILRDYGPRNLSTVVISSLTATAISRHFLGSHPAFKAPPYEMNTYWDIPMYLVFGFLTALCAMVFIRILDRVEETFERIRFPVTLKPAVGGLAVGLIGVYAPQVFGEGYGQIEMALLGKVALESALVLVGLKILATSFTLGSGGSGGIFAPSLFIGAMVGNAYGKLAYMLFHEVAIPPGAAALVGMAGLFAGAARAPLTAMLTVFEMTGDYMIILPLMMTCISSTVVVGHWMKGSIYTAKLYRRGIDPNKVRRADLIETIPVAQAMFKKVVTAAADQTVREVGLSIKRTGHRGFPVLNNQGLLVGIVTRQDINQALAQGKADLPVSEIMNRDLVVCFPDESLHLALEKLGRYSIGRIPVVERHDPSRLVGLITRRGIIEAYNRVRQEKERQT